MLTVIKNPVCLQNEILRLLGKHKVLPKADITHFCTFEKVYSQNDVTNALRLLRQKHRIDRESVPRAGLDGNLYFIERDDDRIKKCKAMMTDREKEILSALGRTGEEYVRTLLFEAKSNGQNGFGHIPQVFKTSDGELKIGNMPLRYSLELGKEKADLIVPYKSRSGESVKLLIESKNMFATIDLTSNELHELIGQSLANQKPIQKQKMHPVLVCNRLTDRAKRFCDSYGLSYLEMGRQIVPARLKAKARKLYKGRLLDERFSFVPERLFRIRTDRAQKLDPRVLADLSTVSNPNWIESALPIWTNRLAEITMIHQAILAGDRETLNRLAP